MTKRFLTGALLALLSTAPLAAQQTTNFVTDANSTGVVPFRTYAGARENLDLKNLNLNVVIPLFTLKGRNGMDVEVVVAYNSVTYEWVEHEKLGGSFYRYDPIPDGGGSDYPELTTAPTVKHLGTWYQYNGQSWNPNRYLVRTADGTRHDLRDKDYDVDVNSTVYNGLERMRAVDGTFMEYRESDNVSSGTLYMKDGTQVSFASGQAAWVRDTNGNKVTFSGDQTTDTLGRVVERTVVGDVTTVKFPDAAGQYLTWTLDNTLAGTGPWTTKLTLPTDNGSNQQRFLFEWNDFGPLTSPDGLATGIYERRLTKVTYPTGGWTRYVWGLSYDLTKTVVKMKCVSAGTGQPEACTSYTEVPYDVRIETRPDGSWIRHTFVSLRGQEAKTEMYSASGVLMKTIDRDWTFQREVPLLTRETTTLNETNLWSKVEYDHDTSGYVWNNVNWSNGNVVEWREYDWGTGAPGALLRKTTRTWWNTAAAGTNGLRILDRPSSEAVFEATGARRSRVEYLYDSYGSPRTLVAAGAVQHDSSFGTSYTTRGNLSRTGRWVSGSTYLYSWNRFDVCGNVVEATDPRGYKTYIRYNSAYQFARPYEVEDPKGFKDTFVYDFNNTYKRGFGLVTRQTDPNGNSTDFSYDRWGRLKTADYPDGGYEDRYYSDTDLTATRSGVYVFKDRANPPYPRVKSHTGIDTGLENVSTGVFDGLGRESMKGAGNGIPGKTDWTRTEYDGNGRLLRTSNPRTLVLGSSEDSPSAFSFTKWTTNSYDGLDRIVETTTPDGQKVKISYPGAETLVVDQANHQRETKADALGRITRTVEPNPSSNSLTSGQYTTTYAWTALDGLKTVTQGAQVRSFAYDGLGRLTSETHPEWGAPGASNGTATYAYDGDSNLTSKTDAAGTVTTHAYDQLNRLTSTTYSDETPSVTYTYDSAAATNGKRRRTGMGDGVGSWSYGYDAMGRVSEITWTNAAFPGGQQTGNFAYNLAGGMKSSAWPGIFDGSTPLTIYWSYDASEKQTAAWWSNAGQSVHQQQLVDGYTFDYTGSSAATWAVETTDLPNGTVETVTYNDRMQPRQRKLTNPSVVWLLDYDFDGADGNNGDVWGIDEGSPGYSSNRDQTFTYDWLDRIKTADVSGQWGLSFAFDRWGNRTAQSATSGNPATNVLAFNQNRNRITSSGSNSYDNAGNLLGAFGKSYQYDAENRIKTVDNGSTATYSYNGDGRRAKRVGDGETRYYFYDPDGNPVWEYKPGVGWETFNFYLNGKHLAVNNTAEGLRWRHQDHLGSLGVKTDSTGAVKCRYWYYPYGELWTSTCAEKDARKFTDKERDPESGLDYFGARYYASVQGRFTSPDNFAGGPVDLLTGQFQETPKPAVYADILNPQTLNKYVYVVNNPVNHTDPDGHCTDVISCPIEFGLIGSSLGPVGTVVGTAIGVGVGGFLTYKAYKYLTASSSEESKGGVESDERNGEHSGYVDTTEPGSDVPNRTTDVTKEEFEKNLEADGFEKSASKDGKVNIFEKDGVKKYTTRETSKSTKGPTAEHFKEGAGKADLKIRLKKPD